MQIQQPYIILGVAAAVLFTAVSGNLFIGIAIGIFTGFVVRVINTVKPEKSTFKNRFETENHKRISFEVYMNYTILLAAEVIKSDGRIYPKEREIVKKHLSKNFSPNEVDKFMVRLEQCLKKSVNIERVCLKIRRTVDYSSRIQLLHLLIRISCSDGILTNKELEIISLISNRIGVAKKTVFALLSMFDFKRIHSHGHNKQKEQKGRKTYTRRSTLERAYSILELKSGASIAEIKKAYRKQAKVHHPDRVAHLGDNHVKIANERFQKIVDAYEKLKKHHNF